MVPYDIRRDWLREWRAEFAFTAARAARLNQPMPIASLRRALGAIVHAAHKPDPWPDTFGYHEIFHVFVILAATTHFVAMAGWIVPSGLDA